MTTAWLFIIIFLVSSFPDTKTSNPLNERWREEQELSMERFIKQLEQERQLRESEQQQWAMQNMGQMQQVQDALQRERMEREDEKQLFLRHQDFEMEKVRRWVTGPEDCVKIQNLKNVTYPRSSKNTGIWVNGEKLRTFENHETYLCRDPPTFPDVFYKLRTVTYSVSSDGATSTNSGFNMKYIDKNGRDFNWEPDMSKLPLDRNRSLQNLNRYDKLRQQPLKQNP